MLKSTFFNGLKLQVDYASLAQTNYRDRLKEPNLPWERLHELAESERSTSRILEALTAEWLKLSQALERK